MTASFIGLAAAVTQDAITLVRLRGSLFIQLASAAAAGDRLLGAVGIGITSTEGVLAGIGSVPTPITEISAESWLWWDFVFIEAVTDAEAVNTGGVAGYRVPIDTKAMRKMNVGDTLYAVWEGSEVSGTLLVNMALNTRALVLLP